MLSNTPVKNSLSFQMYSPKDDNKCGQDLKKEKIHVKTRKMLEIKTKKKRCAVKVREKIKKPK